MPTGKLFFIVLLVALFALGAEVYALQLRDVSFFTGWSLISLGAIIALALIMQHTRGSSSSTGQQFYRSMHLVLGWVMLCLFFLHIDFQLPTGLLDCTIATMFSFICVSGIFGALIEKRLNRQRDVQNMPQFRQACLVEAQQIALKSAELTGNSQLAEFHQSTIKPYFQHIPLMGFARQRQLRQMLKAIQEQSQLLIDHRQSMTELRELIQKKFKVEDQHALNSRLSKWWVVHRFTTYALIVLVLLHIVLVHTFTG